MPKPRDLYDELAGLGVEQHEHTDLMEVIPIADVLYVTRTQKERFDSLVGLPAAVMRSPPSMIAWC